MQEMWDKRYEESPYSYGTEPNQFFKEVIDQYPTGKILLPGDGEGRNAVYAARKGWEVDSFDYSSQAVKHAQELARREGVAINCFQADLLNYSGTIGYYETVAAIYVHLPSKARKEAHRHYREALKPEGILVMEVFSQKQMEYGTGGPSHLDMLYTLEEFEKEFADFEFLLLEEREIDLMEGKYHNGKAMVIRFIGRKKK